MGGACSESLLCCRVSVLHDVILTWAKETLWLAEMTLAHEYRATSTRPVTMFCKIFTAAKTLSDVVRCKIKHYYNIFTVDGSKTFLQMFYFTCNHGLRPMSDTQQSWATLLLNFIAQQICLGNCQFSIGKQSSVHSIIYINLLLK